MFFLCCKRRKWGNKSEDETKGENKVNFFESHKKLKTGYLKNFSIFLFVDPRLRTCFPKIFRGSMHASGDQVIKRLIDLVC